MALILAWMILTGAHPGSVAATIVLGAALAGVLTALHRTRTALRMLRLRVHRADQRILAQAGHVNALQDRYRSAQAEVEKELSAAFQKRIHNLEAALARLESSLEEHQAAAAYDRLRRTTAPDKVRLPKAAVPPTARALIARDDPLDAYALLRGHDMLQELDRTSLRDLRGALRTRGYLGAAAEAGKQLARGGHERAREIWRTINGELAVLSGTANLAIHPEDPLTPAPGRVVHLVGKSLPDNQSGYTLRTHYVVLAQKRAGLDPHVITHMGFSNDKDERRTDEIDGIPYHRIPGAARGEEPLDTWLRRHIQRAANLVRILRPSVLHAASDMLNAETAKILGETFGLPVIYETRGFWEETWLSQRADTFGWDDLEALEREHGLPDLYLNRKAAEDRLRRAANHVVTLDEVMAERIAAGGVPRDRITVVPNAVDVDRFPVLTRDQELASQLEIAQDTIVIGYISSLLAYEGIDTLISAYNDLAGTPGIPPVCLLIVGDGPERERLEEHSRGLGAHGVIFTGRVPHDEVIRYYSLIDIFVVPRRPDEVCHLVTPLKPFEAFSTGRAVVLSDVRALASIAHQSNAAELFSAGDPRSLASVLRALLEDPVRRTALAETATPWVREHRTWEANADRYLRIYDSLGALPLDLSPDAFPTAESVDLDSLRSAMRSLEPLPLERILSAPGDAKKIMTEGWTVSPHPTVRLDFPLDWTRLCTSNRSWNFALHSWHFMEPVLDAFAGTEDRVYLDWCLERAVSWAETFRDGRSHATLAWYDMAMGVRVSRLAFLAELAIRHDAGNATISALIVSLLCHAKMLSSKAAFSPHNNHGVYVALGQLALSRRFIELPGMARLLKQGRERISEMARRQFSPDGGHAEHSPGYHRMVLETFTSAHRAGLITDDSLLHLLGRAEEVLGWFIQPDGAMVGVGDSHARSMIGGAAVSDPHTRFLLTRGHEGVPNPETLRVLPESGYAIVRTPQPTSTDDHESASYLLLQAGFHSRTHKHADDLSLVWFDGGRELLIDAGCYGYVDQLPSDSPLRAEGFYYGAPERMYVESTRAHNTIEADGRNHNRRDRSPYGSAIRSAKEQDGTYYITAAVDHGEWRHLREITFRPGVWLLITDTLTSLDGRPHDYRAWWNLPGDLSPVFADHGFRVDLGDHGRSLWITELGGATPIAPVTSQREPIYRGWRSRRNLELSPAWSLGFERRETHGHVFRTLFNIGDQPLTAPPETVFGDHRVVDAASRHARIAACATAGTDLSGLPVWLPAPLRPERLYRLRAYCEGTGGTTERAALVRFDLDVAESPGDGLTMSTDAGAFTYLQTGPGLNFTDHLFCPAHPIRRIGVQTRGKARGPVRLNHLVIEEVTEPARPSGVFLSFDVEASRDRAPLAPIDTLVWGRIGNAEYGIGRICDILEEYGHTGNFLIDTVTCGAEGPVRLREIFDYLRSRGHETHLHLHPEWITNPEDVSHSSTRFTPFDRLTYGASRHLLEQGMATYEKITGERPLLFRSGGYRMSADLVMAAGSLGLTALSNVRAGRISDRAIGGHLVNDNGPFRWENGVLELPVDVSSPEVGKFETYLRRYRDAVNRKPAEPTFNVVMHSWSLMSRNAEGHHDAYAEQYEETFRQMCLHAAEQGGATGYAAYLAATPRCRPTVSTARIQPTDWKGRAALVAGDRNAVCCTVCHAMVTRPVGGAPCPSCGVMVVHRQLAAALRELGGVLDGRSVLAVGLPCLAERALLGMAASVTQAASLSGAAGMCDCVIDLETSPPTMNSEIILRLLRPGGLLVTTSPLVDLADLLDIHRMPAFDPLSGASHPICFAYRPR